jgi:hypothetical protein
VTTKCHQHAEGGERTQRIVIIITSQSAISMHRRRSGHSSPIALALPLALAAVVLPSPADAQGYATCHPPHESNEAKLLAFFAAPIAFSPGGMASSLPPGKVRVAFEATYVPSPSKAMQQPEACYGLRKTENTNLSPVFPRPRVTLGLPGGLLLEGSYLPPVTVADAEPNLGSVALSRPWRLSGDDERGTVSLLLRAHATMGRVRGSITCPKKSLQTQDANIACYGTDPSSDTYKPNMFGGEAGLAKQAAGGRWGAYATTGVTWLRPRFQVGFQYLGSSFDDTKIVVDMTRFAAGAGAWYRVATKAAITGELYSVPTDATTFRLGGAYTF